MKQDSTSLKRCSLAHMSSVGHGFPAFDALIHQSNSLISCLLFIVQAPADLCQSVPGDNSRIGCHDLYLTSKGRFLYSEKLFASLVLFWSFLSS